jgi:tRNA(fMet)-specific endonuclease VapC
MSKLHLLDTNTISVLASGRSSKSLRRLAQLTPADLRVSCVSHAEIWFGLLRRPALARLRQATADLLAEIDVLPWTRATADTYAQLRVDMESQGKSLAPLDLLIAAQAVEVGLALVTSDRAFQHVPGLAVEDWNS